MNEKTKILILGSGFGGLYTALNLDKSLARDPNVEITLVNRENFFLFTPMLHEVAASDLDITHIVSPVRKLLKHVQILTAMCETSILRPRWYRFRTATSTISTTSNTITWC